MVQHQIETVEVVKPTVVHKVVQRKKPIVQERVQQVPKVMVQQVQAEMLGRSV